MTFGFPFLDFFIGEHGSKIGRPPDGRVRHEGEPDFVDLVATPAFCFEFRNRLGLVFCLAEIRAVKLEENPLGPAHVFWVGCRDFSVPIVSESERFQLPAEVLDICGGGDRWVLASLDRVLLCRQAERIITHGMQDVMTRHPLEAADDVGGGVAFRMTHVEACTAGVGKHIEHVVLRL